MNITDISKNMGVTQNVSFRVIDRSTGQVVSEHVGHNQATNTMLLGIAHYLKGDGVLNQASSMLGDYVPKYISLGTMGLLNQDEDENGLPTGIGETEKDERETDEQYEERRYDEYKKQQPGYGADGYDPSENNGRSQLGLGAVYPGAGVPVKCELISTTFPRSKISYRQIIPETNSERSETIDIVYSAMISTGALAQFRGDSDHIFITEAGLWSTPDWRSSTSNGLLAGYRMMPSDTENWDMSDPENRRLVQESIIRVGINQVVQVIWKLQIGSIYDLIGSSQDLRNYVTHVELAEELTSYVQYPDIEGFLKFKGYVDVKEDLPDEAVTYDMYKAVADGESYFYNVNDEWELLYDASGSGVGRNTEGKTFTYAGTEYVGGIGSEQFNNYLLNNSIGEYSHAEGSSTTALGTRSHAEGFGAVATGNAAHAEGASTKASGEFSHAEGSNTIASGSKSHAEGNGGIYTPLGGVSRTSEASGIASHTEGDRCVASNSASHAEGTITVASGSSSHAEGNNTVSSGSNSHSEGSGTSASGANSHAEGSTSTASGYGTHAEGSSTASGQYAHSEGQTNTASGDRSHAEGQSNHAYGTASHAEGDQTTTGEVSTSNGFAAHAEGSRTTASGYAAHAEGMSTTASGADSHAEGNTTTASGAYAHAEGHTTTASGAYAHAEGYNTSAVKEAAHAEGYQTEVVGIHAHSEGTSTHAIGASSHAEGEGTRSSGIRSHAEGYNSNAVGEVSHAGGYSCSANANYSHASGLGATANNQCSFSHGENTEANANHGTVFGKYNAPSSTDLFQIGNGTGNNARSNAISVNANGNTTISGRYIDGTGIALMPIVSLTQAEYDALDPPLQNVVYCIHS